MTERRENSSRYLAVAVQAAKAGGRILMRHLGRLKRADLARKGEFDWVTRIDRASEKEILRIITGAFPAHTILAEESAPDASPSAWQWMVDPLDGTINYIHRFPMFCVSIALVRNGRPEVGVVYDPLREELFTARRGHGTRLNGRRIFVSAHAGLRESLLATGFPLRAKERLDPYLESFRRIFLKSGSVRRAGSAALDLAYTACGRFDGFWEMALAPWDMAAGALLVEEAGGRVTDFFGASRYLSNGHIVAGNRAIHPQLVKSLTPVFNGQF